jgi:hypothetical protein
MISKTKLQQYIRSTPEKRSCYVLNVIQLFTRTKKCHFHTLIVTGGQNISVTGQSLYSIRA